MTKSKRLIITISILTVNFIIFTIGMFVGIDPISIGTGLSLLNTPVYAYIMGETIRKSDKKR